jgi:hypothetical protein
MKQTWNGSELQAQAHEQGTRQVTYLRKMGTGGLSKGVGRTAWSTGLGASLLLLARFFSSALMLALLLRDCVLHGVAPST